MVIAEGTCTLYIQSVGKKKPIESGIYNALTVGCLSVEILNCVSNAYTLIASVIGAFVGAFLIVKYSK